MLDNLDKFIEGHDVELTKDNSEIFQDDEKIMKRKRDRLMSFEEDKQASTIDSRSKPDERANRDHDERRGGRGRGDRGYGDRGYGDRVDRGGSRDDRGRGGRGDYKPRGSGGGFGGENRRDNQRRDNRERIPDGDYDRLKYDADASNRDPRDSRPAGLRGSRDGARGGGRGRGEGRGGYREDFQRDDKVHRDDDDYYTKQQPTLEANRDRYSDDGEGDGANSRGGRGAPRGGRGGDRGGERGRGRGRASRGSGRGG